MMCRMYVNEFRQRQQRRETHYFVIKPVEVSFLLAIVRLKSFESDDQYDKPFNTNLQT